MSDDLVKFLAARLDEDEAAAKSATPGPWVVGRTAREGGGWERGSHVAAMGAEKRMMLEMNAGYGDGKHVAVAEHIARHDPERILREVAAKRQLLATADQAYYAADHYAHDQILQALAAVYAEHPDYRPEWKPS